MSKYKRKYEKGALVPTIIEFETCDCLFYIWNGKTTHSSVLQSLQYRVLKAELKAGRIYEAKYIGGEECTTLE